MREKEKLLIEECWIITVEGMIELENQNDLTLVSGSLIRNRLFIKYQSISAKIAYQLQSEKYSEETR